MRLISVSQIYKVYQHADHLRHLIKEKNMAKTSTMEKPQTQDCPGHLYKSVTAQYNFINGQWTASSNGETFESANPATGQLLDKFPKSTAGDVDKAVSAAKKAYSSWRKTPVAKRGELLLKAMRILTDKKEAYASEMTKEMGKIIKETRGDVQEAIDTAVDKMAIRVARYLEDLAGSYHRWYDACRVSPVGDEEITDLHRTRLWLNDATGQVLRNGLGLLGVSAPERM